MTATTVYITATGAGTWTVPTNVYRLSLVEVIPGGGGGGGWVVAGGGMGSGAGGAAYSNKPNIDVNPGDVFNLFNGAGGAGSVGAGSASAGQDGWFGGTSYGTALVAAKAGAGAPNGTGLGGLGGDASAGIGTVRFSGGAGGAYGGTNGGAGGGGAAGPNGDGGAGGPSCNYDQVFNTCGAGGGGNGGGAAGARAGGTHDDNNAGRGAGGNNHSGVGGGVPGSSPVAAFDGGGGPGAQLGGGPNPGGAGSNGVDIGGGTKGGGGGGGGGNVDSVFHDGGAGGAGGLYGAGGGSSGGYTTIGVGGAGAPGVIAITYTPGFVSDVPTGTTTWTGTTPLVVNPANFTPAAGTSTWTGATPLPVNPNRFSPGTGVSEWSGGTPTIFNVEQGGFRWQATVISQYVDSPTLVRLIENLNEYLNPAADFDAFYNLVWNVNTAQGWGLDVWGRIVGVTRVLHVSSGGKTFGFEEGGTADYTGFDQAPFYGGGASTTNFALSDQAFRQLILAKALANITDGSIPALNQILLSLFPGRGDCYVTDGEDMTMTYTFAFDLTPPELAIVEQSGVLPKSTGVLATVVHP